MTPVGRIARLERDPRALGAMKLLNVGLAMLWGFAVTFVFVRLLPIAEFKAFLLLVAFANFTISADFGFSGIIYARLRRARVGSDDTGGGAFRAAEIGMLFAFMTGVAVLGGAIIALCLETGRIETQQPALFYAFYALAATNIFALLVKRAMAALDHNMAWELLDAGRRGISVLLLLVALAGMPVLLSIAIQILVSAATMGAGLAIVHREAGMRASDWLGRGGEMRPYLADMGATMALTLSDVAAYNAPYFGIALATHDPRPMLVFDFVFKISRTLTAVIRALTEAALPRLTEAWHRQRKDAVAAGIAKLRTMSLAAAAALAVLLLVAGPEISRILFAGKAVLGRDELAVIGLLLLGLALICVSTYVHNGFGRFAKLLPPSFLFLGGSVLSVLVADMVGAHFALTFLIAYALVHVALGLAHSVMLARLTRR